MNGIFLVGIMMAGFLASCQKPASDGRSSPNGKSDKKDEGAKDAGTDDGNEIAIVRLADDLGECSRARKGKSYYVLDDKKFRYCSDAGQWDEVDIKGSAGAAGKTSLVAVTPESAGSNCAAGGQRIQNGLDTDGNAVLDTSEVTSTSFACNGQAGAAGGAGSSGKPSLVAVTAEAASTNCASGGHKVRSGLDANGSGVLDDSEVQSTSFVCHGAVGAQGSAGVAGASGKNSLVKTTSETAGANCVTGGKKVENGIDANGDGVLSAGEVAGTSYVCNGTTGTAGAAGTDGADGDRYVGRVIYTSAGARLGEIVKEFEYLPASGKPSTATNWSTPGRMFIVHDSTNNFDVGYVASNFTDLTLPNYYDNSASSQVHFRSRKYEDQSLIKLAPYHSSLVYTNSTCNASGVLFAYNMQASYIRTGACNSSCSRMFNNKVLHDYLTGLSLTIAYNYNSTQDMVANCASPVLNNNLQSHGVSGSCETIWNNYDVSTTTPASGHVCSISFVTNVFPDTISAGWYVLKN